MLRLIVWSIRLGSVTLAGLTGLALAGLWFDPLDIIAHFAVVLGAAGGLALVGALLCRDRISIVASIAACLGAATLVAPELTAPRPAVADDARGDRLRLVQFNVLYRNPDPARAAAIIRDIKADVVVLEEANRSSQRIPELLADAYPYRSKCRSCQTVILSRWPIESRAPVIRGPKHPFTWAVIRMPGGASFPIIGLHYLWPGKGQAVQREGLAGQVRLFDRANLIVAGDFNLTPWSYALRRQDKALQLERRTRGLFTFPTSPLPVLPIDHVYAGSNWRTVSVERGPQAGSDHYPVIVTLAHHGPPVATASAKVSSP